MIKKRLVGLLSHAKKYIGFQVFWQWLALIAQMTAVFSIAELLERVLYGLSDAAIMQRTVLVLLVCIAVRFVCERQAAAASYKASVDVKKILRQKIYDKMLRLGPAYREQVSTSEVMQVSTEGVEQLDKIVFIEDGRVEAVGPHDELYRSCAEYRRMVDLQKLEDEEGGGSHG